MQDEHCVFVIFGASGDLTVRKLVPALFERYESGDLPHRFAILGVSRTEMSDASFREHVAPDATGRSAGWESFARHLYYLPLSYDTAGDYRALARRLSEIDAAQGVGGNRLFNLAIPPTLYETVALRLSESGLSSEHDDRWVRLVVEKPFGRDLESARQLDAAIRHGFAERQVFRIDHYLAKETVQNILMLRFANSLLEPVWNRRYVDHVRIVATESLGVEHRAGYYESAGVLRDMFQSHMMQLLAMVAAEPPSVYGADRVRDERVKLFRSLRPFSVEHKYKHLVLGQYTEGSIDGSIAPAYRDEPGVDPSSLTPTYATLRVFVDNWRWQGVPFYLTSGKRLREKETKVEIHFKGVPHSMFRGLIGEEIEPNRLTLGIFPSEEIALRIVAKSPGTTASLRPVHLRFDYYEGYDHPPVDAYGKSLGDALRGDHMLFWRQDALEQTWAFFDPIIQACEGCDARAECLRPYDAGSTGPEDALAMIPASHAEP